MWSLFHRTTRLLYSFSHGVILWPNCTLYSSSSNHKAVFNFYSEQYFCFLVCNVLVEHKMDTLNPNQYFQITLMKAVCLCVSGVSYATLMCFQRTWMEGLCTIWEAIGYEYSNSSTQYNFKLKANSHWSQMTLNQWGSASIIPPTFPSVSFNWLMLTLQAIPLLLVLPQPIFYKPFVLVNYWTDSCQKQRG